VDDAIAEWNDEALCERVARKDEAAFDVLVERYRQRAYRLAWSFLRNADDARDLSQEAFLRLYQTAGSFRGRAASLPGSTGSSSTCAWTIAASIAGGGRC